MLFQIICRNIFDSNLSLISDKEIPCFQLPLLVKLSLTASIVKIIKQLTRTNGFKSTDKTESILPKTEIIQEMLKELLQIDL